MALSGPCPSFTNEPMQKKWAQIQSILENRLASGQVKAWIASLSPSWEEGGLVLCAQTEFAAAHIRSWYGGHIGQAVKDVCGQDCPVRIVTRACAAALPAVRGSESPLAASTPGVNASGSNSLTVSTLGANTLDANPLAADAVLLQAARPAPQDGGALSGLHGRMEDRARGMDDRARFTAGRDRKASVLPSPRPLPPMQLGLPVMEALNKSEAKPDCHWRYSFDDFVVGPCNELAHAASKSMCGSAGQVDVLFLSSAPGLGKTHLMHAVGSVLSAACNRARPNVEYLTAEEFASRFYLSIKGQDTDRFKARYRSLDLLLLEDVHFLQGKEKMQAELLATVKALRDRGGKVVFSSSFAPRELKQVEDQLMSRFSAGLLSYIERPDEETRRRILRSKASLHQVILPGEVEDMLARYIHADVRQIESCLHNLILKARLLNSRITPEMAWEIIGHYAEHTPILDMDAIIGQVCRCFSVSREQLVSASRKQEYVTARSTAYYLARKHTDLSLESIGRRFNRRHSTVLKGITGLEREMSMQSPSGRQIANVLQMIERTGSIVLPVQ